MVRNESQFIKAVREGYADALPGRTTFTKQIKPGEPDWYIKIMNKDKLTLMYDCYAEFKWRAMTPMSIASEWALVRGLQGLSLIRMAADGKDVFLVVGHADKMEGCWYYLHPAQAKKVVKNEAAPESMLALMMVSKPWKPGKWSTGSDWGEADEGPGISWAQKLAMNKIMKRNGLILPK